MKTKTSLESFYIAANWIRRSESCESIERRVDRFLCELQSLHELFGCWFQQGGSKAEALSKRLRVGSPQAIRALITDAGYVMNPEPAVSIGIWNGRDGREGASLSATINLSGKETHGWSLVKLILPSTDAFVAALGREQLAMRLMHLTAMCWEPRSAALTSTWLRTEVYPHDLPEIQAGWLTYIARSKGIPRELPQEYCCEPIGTLGRLLAIRGVTRMTANEPAQVGAVRELAHWLSQIDTDQ